jgi:hypothetical protein
LLTALDPATEWRARKELLQPIVRAPSLASIRASLESEVAA